MIKFENIGLSKSHNTILNNINIDIASGEIFGISGDVASGKNTLLSIPFLKKGSYSGNVKIGMEDLSELSKKSFDKSVNIFNNDATDINTESSLFNTVLSGRNCYKKFLSSYSATDKDLTLSMIRTFKLEDYKDIKLKNLSKSLQQLTLIARAFNKESTLLLLNSPDSQLNFNQYSLLKNAMNKYISSSGKSIILETNNLNFMLSVCDKIIFLKKGVIKRQCRPEEVDDSIIKEIFSVNSTISKNIVTGKPELQLIESI